MDAKNGEYSMNLQTLSNYRFKNSYERIYEKLFEFHIGNISFGEILCVAAILGCFIKLWTIKIRSPSKSETKYRNKNNVAVQWAAILTVCYYLYLCSKVEDLNFAIHLFFIALEFFLSSMLIRATYYLGADYIEQYLLKKKTKILFIDVEKIIIRFGNMQDIIELHTSTGMMTIDSRIVNFHDMKNELFDSCINAEILNS